jgi:hypothetical protein
MFTKQHYIEVAKVIRASGASKKAQRKMAQDFGDMFARDNPRFDRQRWNEAIEAGLVRVRANTQPRAL